MYRYSEVSLLAGESYTLSPSEHVVGSGVENGDVKLTDNTIVKANTYLEVTTEDVVVEAVSDCLLTLVIHEPTS